MHQQRAWIVAGDVVAVLQVRGAGVDPDLALVDQQRDGPQGTGAGRAELRVGKQRLPQGALEVPAVVAVRKLAVGNAADVLVGNVRVHVEIHSSPTNLPS